MRITDAATNKTIELKGEPLKEYILDAGRRLLAERGGNMFSMADFNACEYTPHTNTVRRHFGSFSAFQQMLKPDHQVCHTQESLIEVGRHFLATRNGEMFTAKEFNACEYTPRSTTVLQFFPSFIAYQLAVDPTYQPVWTSSSAIRAGVAFIKACYQTGHWFTYQDQFCAPLEEFYNRTDTPDEATINQLFGDSDNYAMQVYWDRRCPHLWLMHRPESCQFGSDSSWTRSSALNAGRRLVAEQGRMFNYEEFRLCRYVPSAEKIYEIFGSFRAYQVEVQAHC